MDNLLLLMLNTKHVFIVILTLIQDVSCNFTLNEKFYGLFPWIGFSCDTVSSFTRRAFKMKWFNELGSR
jgi:hypothetical protein